MPGPDAQITGSDVAGLRTSGFGHSGALGGGAVVGRENPSRTAESVGKVEFTSVDAVDVAVEGAAAAQREWAATPIGDRLDLLRQAASAVAATADDLGTVLASETGKPRADSSGEMGFAAGFLNWVCDQAEAVCADSETNDAAGRVVLTREPFGVVAAVVPWNAPLILSSLKVAPALATGNAIVVKPSPVAPFAVTAALSELAKRLPAGILSVVHGGAEVGTALIQHPSVRKVSFTGGQEVARSVLRLGAETLTPTVMELGGNDAALVLDDLEFTEAVMERMVFGAFLTSGQVCMAAKRFLVPEHRLEQFVEGFTAAARRVLVCGDPLDPTVTMGPVATPAQRDHVNGLVDDSRKRGAMVHEIGATTAAFDPTAGYYVRPTLVTGLTADAPLVAEEQFGPSVPVLGYSSLDEGVALANDSSMGLASSVWSDDESRAFDVGRRIEAGMTFINCHNRAGMSFRVPFGGVKKSGFGREFGEEGIAEYVQTHALHLPGAVRDAGGEPGKDGRSSGGPRPNEYPT